VTLFSASGARCARLFIASVTLVGATAIAAPSAVARQLFVAPDGAPSGSCEQYAPCTPEQAINVQARGTDEVVVAPGSYTVTAPLVARDAVAVHGLSAQPRPTLTNDGTGSTTVPTPNGSGGSIYQSRTLALTDQATASHLTLFQTGQNAFALELDGTTATDVSVIATGNYARAVLANDGAGQPLLRDAVAFANGGAASAIETLATNLRLRNVLAVAPYVSGDALDIEGGGWCYSFSCPGAVPSAVDAKNTILRGALADVALTTSGYPGSYAKLSIDHSNFRPTKVVAPGGNGLLDDRGANQSADPQFVNSQAGDYRPAAGSPTIDAGTADPDNAAVDMDGNPHPSGVAVDIGPYEYIPAAATPTPAPTTSAPAPTSAPITLPPPVPTVSGVPGSRPLASPRLTVTRPVVARDRRTITIDGRVAAGVSGRVTVTASARIGGRLRTVRGSVPVRRQRFNVRLKLPSRAWTTAKVTARYAGSSTHRATAATRTVRQRGR